MRKQTIHAFCWLPAIHTYIYIDWSSFSPLSASICTTILAGLSTSWRIFLFGAKRKAGVGVGEGKERQEISVPQNMLYKSVYRANVQDACTTNWWSCQLSFAIPKLTVWKEDRRETNLSFCCLYLFIFFCLPKLARGAVRVSSTMPICMCRALGLSVLSLKKGILAWDTLSILDNGTLHLSPTPIPSPELPDSISNPVTNSRLFPCSTISHTPAIVSATSVVHKASHFTFRSVLQNNS